MPARGLFLLSPYRPPTSYPVSLSASEAAAWLNAYAALWHPAALERAEALPQPASAYDHDSPQDDALYAVPQGPHLYQPDDWTLRLEQAGAKSFPATADRAATFAEMLNVLNDDRPYDATLVANYTAIGFGYLMLDTLCDAMNHDRLLDADAFRAAIHEALANPAAADAHLRRAAELLHSARESMTSGTIHVLDTALLKPGLAFAGWPESLRSGRPANVIAAADQLLFIQRHHPEAFDELKSRVPGSVDIACGAATDRADAFLPVESQLWTLGEARRTVKELFGDAPLVHARFSTAAQPSLPSWLVHAGYKYAVAVPLDGATAPPRYAAVINWPGPDGRSVEALGRAFLPADDPGTFFNFAYHTHKAVSEDSTAVLPLMHTGPAAVGYDDWLTLSSLAPVFGEPKTFTQFFADVPAGEYSGTSNADEFFNDTLDQRVSNDQAANPASGHATHARRRKGVDAALALRALHRVLTPPAMPDPVLELEELERQIELCGPAADAELTARVDAAVQQAAQQLAERLQQRAEPGKPGFMVFNPCGFTRRVALELPDQPGPIAVDGPVKAAEFNNNIARIVVEVPGLGYAWVPRGSASVAVPKPRMVTAEHTSVRNEFLIADLDPTTGGVRAVRDAKAQYSRLGQLLTFNPGSRMKATGVAVSHCGAALGEVTSEGVIESEHGEVLAKFRQRLRAWLGRPAIELRTEITPVHRPTGYPWHAYYGARFAWRDDRAAAFRAVAGQTVPTTAARPCSPDFFEIRFGSSRTFLFTGGLPFLQKSSSRMLDAILIPEGETETTYEFLMALDRDQPMATAAGWNAPAPVVPTDRGPPPGGPSGWLAHIDWPSLLPVAVRPVADRRAILMRFLETSGYAGQAEIRFAKDPTAVHTADLNGETIAPITMQGDAVPLEFSGGELLTIVLEY
jgi:hypothetical protein